jgi:hypothetical protein
MLEHLDDEQAVRVIRLLLPEKFKQVSVLKSE